MRRETTLEEADGAWLSGEGLGRVSFGRRHQTGTHETHYPNASSDGWLSGEGLFRGGYLFGGVIKQGHIKRTTRRRYQTGGYPWRGWGGYLFEGAIKQVLLQGAIKRVAIRGGSEDDIFSKASSNRDT